MSSLFLQTNYNLQKIAIEVYANHLHWGLRKSSVYHIGFNERLFLVHYSLQKKKSCRTVMKKI